VKNEGQIAGAGEVFFNYSRQDEFIKRIARVAGEYPEHDEMSRVRGENFAGDDQQRFGNANDHERIETRRYV
jgi:hypothetical protein